jgi:hypothetical protein
VIPDNPSTPLTDVAAVAAAASPLWLHSMSDFAAMALPILGCAWLLMQAGLKLYSMFWKKTDDRKD